jgi:hypothetical protein
MVLGRSVVMLVSSSLGFYAIGLERFRAALSGRAASFSLRLPPDMPRRWERTAGMSSTRGGFGLHDGTPRAFYSASR